MPRYLPMELAWLAPRDVLPPRLAARIAVIDGHWLLQPVRDGRRRRDDRGACNSKQYACVGGGRKGRTVLLSHLVLTRVFGPRKPDQQACHNDAVCAVRYCVAPAHLRWGTAAENQRDATIKRMRNRAQQTNKAA